jgi:Ran GTPase-activating protein (RanGAP) involved in mRNA processing and transport
MDAGAFKIAKMLLFNRSLRTLKLNRNEIGEPGGNQLAKAMKTNKTLEVLDLA